MTAPFWEALTLDALSPAQWESLCDGCGRCCLHKLTARDTGRVHYTRVACALLDREAVRCTDYPERHRRVPACVPITPESVAQQTWLPATCAYRLVAERKPLPEWHPLVSGDADSVRRAGISVAGRVIGEEGVTDLWAHVARWIR